MPKKRELTGEERQECARLRAAWERYRAEHKGTTQTWLAAETDLGTQSAVSHYLNGKQPLNMQALATICSVLGIDPAVISPRLARPLLNVLGFSRGVADHPAGSGASRELGTVGADGYINIGRYDAAASMGNGLALHDYADVVEHLRVSADWLQSHVKFSSPRNLGLLTAYGDSMEPTFRDGDMLLVDRGIGDVKIDAVYVLALNDELYIKRLQRRPDGAVLMISDNKKYDPYTITEADRQKFHVLGRVLMAWNATKL